MQTELFVGPTPPVAPVAPVAPVVPNIAPRDLKLSRQPGILHMGRNGWYLFGLPNPKSYMYYGVKSQEEAIQAFNNYLEDLIDKQKARYLCAITANLGQKGLSSTFIQNKFNPVVTCYSSHGSYSETLTLWVRKDKQISAETVTPLDNLTYVSNSNCSIGLERSKNKRLVVFMSEKGANNEGFTRVPFTPLFYKINGLNEWGQEVGKDARAALGLQF